MQRGLGLQKFMRKVKILLHNIIRLRLFYYVESRRSDCCNLFHDKQHRYYVSLCGESSLYSQKNMVMSTGRHLTGAEINNGEWFRERVLWLVIVAEERKIAASAMFRTCCTIFLIIPVSFSHAGPKIYTIRYIQEIQYKSRAIAGRTARCRCNYRYVLKFTAASRGFSATPRLSCIVLHQQPFKLRTVRWFSRPWRETRR